MKKVIESAPAKFILFGEHAVVYGYPAIALPVLDLRAFCVIENAPTIDRPLIIAEDYNVVHTLSNSEIPEGADHIVQALTYFKDKTELKLPDLGWKLKIWSEIPIARGLGSSAAINIALIKSLYKFSGRKITEQELLKHSFELEKYHHGQPSGIDNTVIAIEKPVIFQKGTEIRTISSTKFQFVIGDTGIGKNTGSVVSDVARCYQEQKEKYTMLFSSIGNISLTGLEALRSGKTRQLGELMNKNQKLLQEVGVSNDALNNLNEIACQSGALGAKLCGAGRGGCMVALAPTPVAAQSIRSALLKNGAAHCFISHAGGRS